MRLILMNYNNYFNRIYKTESTVADYISAASAYRTFNNINFKERDHVNTTQTINIGIADTISFSPDYLVVTEDNSDVIESRWFVLDTDKTRGNQMSLTLRRDVLVDEYDNYSGQPFYLEKGTPPTLTNNPFLYTNEGQSFSQVLKSRTALKHSGNSTRWLVGYVDATWGSGLMPQYPYYAVYDSAEECPFWQYAHSNKILLYQDSSTTWAFGFDLWSRDDGSGKAVRFNMHGGGSPAYTTSATLDNKSIVGYAMDSNTYYDTIRDATVTNAGAQRAAMAVYDNFSKGTDPYVDLLPASALSGYNGHVILIGNQAYTVTITPGVAGTYMGYHVEKGSDLYNVLVDTFGELNHLNAWMTGGQSIDLQKPAMNTAMWIGAYACTTVSVSLTRQSSYDPISFGAGRHKTGLPYDIFCVADDATNRKNVSWFASQYAGSNAVYDVQCLPIKPDLTGAGTESVNGVTYYWLDKDSVSGTFEHSAIATYSTNTDKKAGSNLDMCRIVSPDCGAIWEFNPAQIGGVAANSIRYEATFAPLAPYIHIFPTFGGIYGNVNKSDQNTAESRGIVLTGDYSIPYSSSNWATYQLQNSAYRLSHDRMIQNMSITQNAERTQEQVNIVAGALTAGLGGAASGAGIGGPVGAAVGGVLGAAGSAVTGAVAYGINEKLRAEDMSYAEDMFGYQMRNIQAQPQPLAHTNSLTVGNANFPFIEYYTCYDNEKDIFLNRLTVNGWALGYITTAATAFTNAHNSTLTKFVKGRLIKYGGAHDSHIANTIAEELMKGVRLT